MAQRRMFSPEIVESDAFLDMPISSQALYFHLGMYADDDGFVNPKKIMRMTGTSDDDLKILVAKRFALTFPSGVIVIKHWKINNLVRKDWYRPSQYIEEKNTLDTKENGAYTELDPSRQQFVNDSSTQVRLGKVRLVEDTSSQSSDKPKKKRYGEYKHVLLSDEEKEKLKEKFGVEGAKGWVTKMDEAIEMKGYKYKSHYLAILKWSKDETKGAKSSVYDKARKLEKLEQEQLDISSVELSKEETERRNEMLQRMKTIGVAR